MRLGYKLKPMKWLANLPRMLGFSARALQDQAERQMVFGGIACFCAGFAVYGLVRNDVYAELPEISAQASGLISSFLYLNRIQTLFFVLLVFVPGLILLANAIPGGKPGPLISGREYRLYISSLLPLWGLLFFLTSPVQWIIPHFLLIGNYEISIGLLVRSILLSVYTVWAVKRMNSLTTVQALGIFILSWITLPVLFELT